MLDPVAPDVGCAPPTVPADPLPPLMRKLLADYAATGLSPAYLPKDETKNDEKNDHERENNDDQ